MDGVNDVIWTPSPESVERANVTRFMRRHGIRDYDELVRRSTADTSWFWDAALKDLGVVWDRPYEKVQEGGFPIASWFVGGKLNIVTNCIERGRGSKPAVVWAGDDGESAYWDYATLEKTVARIALGLRQTGLGKGDTVGIYMPMIPEIVAVFFACLKIGAVAVPVFSAYGAPALAVRLQDAEAKVLFTVDGVSRRGKKTPLKPEADLAVKECPSIRNVIVLRRLGIDVPMGPKDAWWHESVDTASDDAATADLEAEDTSIVIYTSGTTGRPKGTVHTHAGALAQVIKELGYNFDLKPDDVFFWVTDIGWMMGPWEMIGAAFFGATLVLCEGAPNYPNPDRLWDMVERHRVTHLGISPTAIRLLKASPLE